MLLLQMLAAAASVYALARQGAIEVAPLSLSRARQLAPISALYCSNTAFALASLDGMCVPPRANEGMNSKKKNKKK